MTLLETPCREWRGSRFRSGGYGRIWRENRDWRVHRWVWTLASGPIPEGLHVLHRCDNPPCYRLDHLFLGTQADNNRDRDAKGRRGDTTPISPARGEEHGMAKLTWDNVRLIRASSESNAALARRFGVVPARISEIRHHKTWVEPSVDQEAVRTLVEAIPAR